MYYSCVIAVERSVFIFELPYVSYIFGVLDTMLLCYLRSRFPCNNQPCLTHTESVADEVDVSVLIVPSSFAFQTIFPGHYYSTTQPIRVQSS